MLTVLLKCYIYSSWTILYLIYYIGFCPIGFGAETINQEGANSLFFSSIKLVNDLEIVSLHDSIHLVVHGRVFCWGHRVELIAPVSSDVWTCWQVLFNSPQVEGICVISNIFSHGFSELAQMNVVFFLWWHVEMILPPNISFYRSVKVFIIRTECGKVDILRFRLI